MDNNWETTARKLLNFSAKRKLETRVVRAFFGLSLDAIGVIWLILLEWCPNRIREAKFHPQNLLLTLYYLRRYPTYEEAEIFSKKSAKTIRKIVWTGIDFLYNFLETVRKIFPFLSKFLIFFVFFPF